VSSALYIFRAPARCQQNINILRFIVHGNGQRQNELKTVSCVVSTAFSQRSAFCCTKWLVFQKNICDRFYLPALAFVLMRTILLHSISAVGRPIVRGLSVTGTLVWSVLDW